MPVVVTLLGWFTLIKGAVLIATPSNGLKTLYLAMHYPVSVRAVMLAGAALSAWLIVIAIRA